MRRFTLGTVRGKALALGAAAAIGVAAMGGSALVGAQTANNSVVVCAAKLDFTLHLPTRKDGGCGPNEQLLNVSTASAAPEAGPAGPTGATGATGPAGAATLPEVWRAAQAHGTGTTIGTITQLQNIVSVYVPAGTYLAQLTGVVSGEGAAQVSCGLRSQAYPGAGFTTLDSLDASDGTTPFAMQEAVTFTSPQTVSLVCWRSQSVSITVEQSVLLLQQVGTIH